MNGISTQVGFLQKSLITRYVLSASGGQYVSLPDKNITNSTTITFIVKCNSDVSQNIVASASANNRVFIDPSGVSFQLNGTATAINHLTTITDWHRYDLIRSGSILTLKVDGVVTGSAGLGTASSSEDYTILAKQSAGSIIQAFSGQMARVAFNYDERNYLLDSTSGTTAVDSGTDGQNGTLQSGASFVLTSDYPKAIDDLTP